MEYYMLNKPRGCITATRDARHATVYDYVPEALRERVFPVGRLDKDTEGLLLLTDDGALAARLLHPMHDTEKCYEFFCVGEMTEDKARALSSGVYLDADRTVLSRPADFSLLSLGVLEDITERLSDIDRRLLRRHPKTPVFHATLTVTEGKKHQIKRMMLAVGCRVVWLKRLRIGALCLDPSLPVGALRALTDDERALLTGECVDPSVKRPSL